MGRVIDFSTIYNKNKDIEKQITFLQKHYLTLLKELSEEIFTDEIVIVRSELAPLPYLYIIDWYYLNDRIPERDKKASEVAKIEDVMQEISFILLELKI